MRNIKFWSHKLFKNHPKAIISYRDIARLYDISVRSARNYIRRDLKIGMIFKEPSLSKKNCYYLTSIGYGYLHKDLLTPPPLDPPMDSVITRGLSKKMLQ